MLMALVNFSELRRNHLYVVMEKGETDLATFLNTRRKQIDEFFIRFYWSEMLKCVRTIHERGHLMYTFLVYVCTDN